MKLPTLNDLTRYLDHLDACDRIAVGAAIDGYLTTSEAQLLLVSNQAQRATFLDEAFQMAHTGAHAEKARKALVIRKVA